MNAIIVPLLPTLLGLVVKATALLLAAGLVCGLARRASAAARHLLGSAALAALLLLPVLSATLPRWNVAWASPSPVPTVTPAAPASPLDTGPPADAAPGRNPEEQAAPGRRIAPSGKASFGRRPKAMAGSSSAGRSDQMGHFTAPAPRPDRPFPWASALLSLWTVGTLARLVRLAVGLVRAGRLGRRAVPLTPTETALAESARRQIGPRRRVTFRRATDGDAVPVPITWGLWRPVVLLPPASASWSEDCLRAALLHELAHAGRGDWATQLMGHLACALYWWHPLAWHAARQAREEGERACDDLVLGTGMPPADYAQRLVDVVRSLPPDARPGPVAVALAARPSEVAGRVQAVLARGRDRRRLSRRTLASALTASAALLLPLAALRPVARAAPPAGDSSERHSLQFLYLKDASSDGKHGRPALLTTRVADGRWSYVLINEATGQQARNPQQVRADLTGLLSEGWRPRPDAQPYRVPPALAAVLPARRVFFTPEQQQVATKLAREKAAWDRLLRDAPVIATGADVEPQTTASVRPQNTLPGVPQTTAGVINVRLSPAGARKMAAFTAAHHGEILGILLDGDLLTAPMIEGTIRDTEGVIGLQAPLADLQQIAQRINEAATAPVTPPVPAQRPSVQLPDYVRQLGIQRFKKAMQLRTHLQDWAITHAELLAQMAQARSGDLDPAMRVYSSLQMSMLISSQADWAGDPRTWAFEMPLGLTLSHLQRSPEPIDRMIRGEIARDHDFMVARSAVPGTLILAVWASGRITLETHTLLPAVGRGKPLREVDSRREIVPPFLPPDFAAQPVYGYRRYVSLPLPDGTRYTFLYPTCDTQVQQQRPGPKDPTWFTIIGNRSPMLGWAAARGQTPIPPAVWENGALFRAPYEESCSIVVGRAGEVRFPAGVHVLRRDTGWSGKGESQHALALTDQRTGMRFLLTHENRSLPALFRQTDPVIMGSFRLLPP